jgi:hypothetical protein
VLANNQECKVHEPLACDQLSHMKAVSDMCST